MIRLLTYLDLSVDQRKKAAAQQRGLLQAAAANPFLAVEQRQQIVAQQGRITAWERGTLPLGTSPKS